VPFRGRRSQHCEGKSQFVRRTVPEASVAADDETSRCKFFEPSSNGIATVVNVIIHLNGGAPVFPMSPEQKQDLELLHGHDVVGNDHLRGDADPA
jgi:hypothetical protein